jgi:hypothetical protein
VIIKSEHSSDAGHWYDAVTGEPTYTIQKSDGTGIRNTTLRDARKLNLVPSVTTILAQIAKPGLQVYLNQQILLSALTLPKNENEPEAQWLERVLIDSKEAGRKAADRGNNIHAIIETYFANDAYILEYPKYVYQAEQALDNELGIHKWVAEQSFAHQELRYGGKCDLHAPADPLTDFPGAVIDIKTKETDLEGIKSYAEHLYQLAAYRQGLGMPNAICGNLFVNALTNEVRLVLHDPSDIADSWAIFCHLLRVYQIKNKI